MNEDRPTDTDDTVIDPRNIPDENDRSKEDAPMTDQETVTTNETSKTPRSWSTRTVVAGGVVAVLLGLGAGAALGANLDDDHEGHFGPGGFSKDGGPGHLGRGPMGQGGPDGGGPGMGGPQGQQDQQDQQQDGAATPDPSSGAVS
jgi:hypothetical protein